MLREQNPSKLATVGAQRSTLEKEKDEEKLLIIKEKEKIEKKEKMRKIAGSRFVIFNNILFYRIVTSQGNYFFFCLEIKSL